MLWLYTWRVKSLTLKCSIWTNNHIVMICSYNGISSIIWIICSQWLVGCIVIPNVRGRIFIIPSCSEIRLYSRETVIINTEDYILSITINITGCQSINLYFFRYFFTLERAQSKCLIILIWSLWLDILRVVSEKDLRSSRWK